MNSGLPKNPLAWVKPKYWPTAAAVALTTVGRSMAARDAFAPSPALGPQASLAPAGGSAPALPGNAPQVQSPWTRCALQAAAQECPDLATHNPHFGDDELYAWTGVGGFSQYAQGQEICEEVSLAAAMDTASYGPADPTACDPAVDCSATSSEAYQLRAAASLCDAVGTPATLGGLEGVLSHPVEVLRPRSTVSELCLAVSARQNLYQRACIGNSGPQSTPTFTPTPSAGLGPVLTNAFITFGTVFVGGLAVVSGVTAIALRRSRAAATTSDANPSAPLREIPLQTFSVHGDESTFTIGVPQLGVGAGGTASHVLVINPA